MSPDRLDQLLHPRSLEDLLRYRAGLTPAARRELDRMATRRPCKQPPKTVTRAEEDQYRAPYLRRKH